MGQRRTFSAEYKREAVAMRNAPCGSVSQLAAELGIGAGGAGTVEARIVPEGRRRRSPGRSRDEKVGPLRQELARVTKEQDFFARSGSVHRDEASDDPTMPRYVSHPDDVPVLAGLPQ